MTRVVVEVAHQMTGGLQLSLVEPSGIQGAGDWYPFPCATTDPAIQSFMNGTSPVTAVGGYLAQGLRSHPAVNQALTGLLIADPNNGTSPLFVRMTIDSEALPWETLYDQNAFLALDRLTPVARMGLGFQWAPAVDFEPPLRIMAVLGAAEVPAIGEWKALADGLANTTFPIAISVLYAEDDVRDAVRAFDHPSIEATAEPVPSTPTALVQKIMAFRPNLLHVFSHGPSVNESAWLQIATRASWPNATGNHVVLETKDLGTKAITDSVWVLSLNVCRGAAAGGSGSLVYSLLNRGFPVVAGMREPEDDIDAHLFCRGFYRAMTDLLGRPIAGGPDVDLDLAALMYEPRLEICNGHSNGAPCSQAAMTSREWTLPVLYVRPFGLTIRRRQPAGVRSPRRWGPRPPAVDMAVPAPAAPGPVAPVVDGPVDVVMSPAEQERRTLETKLGILKDLVLNPLPGTDPAAIDLYRAEVRRIETTLYGQR